MAPTLAEGDLLLARPARSARPGQVVVVDWRDGVHPLSVKRLLRRDEDGWWVGRDNAREGVDSWTAGAVPPDGLVAVVLVRLWPRPGRLPGPPADRSR